MIGILKAGDLVLMSLWLGCDLMLLVVVVVLSLQMVEAVLLFLSMVSAVN